MSGPLAIDQSTYTIIDEHEVVVCLFSHFHVRIVRSEAIVTMGDRNSVLNLGSEQD